MKLRANIFNGNIMVVTLFELTIDFRLFEILDHWFLTGVPRNYESRIFFFITIMTREEFYKIFQNIKFKYI